MIKVNATRLMRSGPAKASGFNKTDMAGNDTDLTSIIQQGQLVIQLTSPYQPEEKKQLLAMLTLTQHQV